MKYCTRRKKITILENIDFVEAAFSNKKEAKEYLFDHPKKENCKLLESGIHSFPFFIIENGWGKFSYHSTKNEVTDFLKKLNWKDINIGRITKFIIDENNDTEIETSVGPSIIIYKISEPFASIEKNSDEMGTLRHYHIDQEVISEIRGDKIANLVM